MEFFFNYEIYRFLKTSPAIGGFFHARAKFELLKKKEKSAMLEIVSGLTQTLQLSLGNYIAYFYFLQAHSVTGLQNL